MNRDDAARVLRVDLPTTEAALKTAFRRRALEVHPDQNKAADASCAFIALKEALDLLLADPEAVTGVEAAARCADGTLLTELGQGLGPTTNGKPCPHCHGVGFTAYRVEDTCRDCHPDYGRAAWTLWGVSNWKWKCHRCGGTGRYVRDGRDRGECFACHGTGEATGRQNCCPTCHGTQKDPDRGRKQYQRCYECKGTGEIVVLNPVLPKGLLCGLVG